MTVEQLALTLKDKHWFAIVDAVAEGVGYICSDFEEGELTAQQCRDLFAYRNEVARKVRADSALERWAREKALTLKKEIWLALDFIPPEDDADWVGAVALGLMECPEGPSYEHLLTNKGKALLAMRNKVASGLTEVAHDVLRGGPTFGTIARETGTVMLEQSGLITESDEVTTFGQEILRTLKADLG